MIEKEFLISINTSDVLQKENEFLTLKYEFVILENEFHTCKIIFYILKRIFQ